MRLRVPHLLRARRDYIDTRRIAQEHIAFSRSTSDALAGAARLARDRGETGDAIRLLRAASESLRTAIGFHDQILDAQNAYLDELRWIGSAFCVIGLVLSVLAIILAVA